MQSQANVRLRSLFTGSSGCWLSSREMVMVTFMHGYWLNEYIPYIYRGKVRILSVRNSKVCKVNR